MGDLSGHATEPESSKYAPYSLTPTGMETKPMTDIWLMIGRQACSQRWQIDQSARVPTQCNRDVVDVHSPLPAAVLTKLTTMTIELDGTGVVP
jgi:hypothetical protein